MSFTNGWSVRWLAFSINWKTRWAVLLISHICGHSWKSTAQPRCLITKVAFTSNAIECFQCKPQQQQQQLEITINGRRKILYSLFEYIGTQISIFMWLVKLSILIRVRHWFVRHFNARRASIKWWYILSGNYPTSPSNWIDDWGRQLFKMQSILPFLASLFWMLPHTNRMINYQINIGAISIMVISTIWIKILS